MRIFLKVVNTLTLVCVNCTYNLYQDKDMYISGSTYSIVATQLRATFVLRVVVVYLYVSSVFSAGYSQQLAMLRDASVSSSSSSLLLQS